MKLHELKPAAGSRRPRTRVGRGIAAGKGKTAGRGTKGQKSRAGASIPPWFEGGQTPIHVRVPKLRGFRNRAKVVFQVVNVGRISEYAAAGRFGVEAAASGARSKATGVTTVNGELLAAAGLVRAPDRPIKVLGQGEVDQKLLIVADAFTAGARRKIEAAGGFVQPLAPEKEAAPAAESSPDVEKSPVEAEPAAQVDAEPAGAEEAESAAPSAAAEAKARPARRPRAKKDAETAE